MASVAEMISHIRLKLGDPKPENPRDEVIMTFLKDAAQQLYNELANTASNWTLKKARLTLVPGQDTYLFPFSDFSQELCMLTVDDTDPNHWQREVMICEVQNTDQFFSGPLKDQGSGYKHTAQTASFYLMDGQVYVRVRPVPIQAAEYEIWYVPGPYNVNSFGPVIGFEQFHPMLENQIAIAVAGLCRWQGAGPDETIMRVQERVGALSKEYAAQKDTFDHYKKSIAIPQIEDRILYGETWDESGFGAGSSNWWWG